VFTRTCYQHLRIQPLSGFSNVGTFTNSGDNLALSFKLSGVDIRKQNGDLVEAPMAGF
jgi:hypothetical protein